MKCERCGCDGLDLYWTRPDGYFHADKDSCIAALKAKLVEKEPKPERFAGLRHITSMKVSPSWWSGIGEVDVTQEIKDLLAAYDEAKPILTLHDFHIADAHDWVRKWG
jgi:hypothetical protein